MPARGGVNSPGKHPLTTNGVNDSSADEKVLLHWNQKWPLANWALAGGLNGLAVIDIDPAKGGDPREVIAAHELADRPGAWTGEALDGPLEGERGAHVWATGESTGNDLAAGVKGVDVIGGYVILPGSRHVSGVVREWWNDRRPWNTPLKPVPESIGVRVAHNGTQATLVEPGELVPHGQRHPYLKDFGSDWYAAGSSTSRRSRAPRVRVRPHLRTDRRHDAGYFERLARSAAKSRIAQRKRVDRLESSPSRSASVERGPQ